MNVGGFDIFKFWHNILDLRAHIEFFFEMRVILGGFSGKFLRKIPWMDIQRFWHCGACNNMCWPGSIPGWNVGQFLLCTQRWSIILKRDCCVLEYMVYYGAGYQNG